MTRSSPRWSRRRLGLTALAFGLSSVVASLTTNAMTASRFWPVSLALMVAAIICIAISLFLSSWVQDELAKRRHESADRMDSLARAVMSVCRASESGRARNSPRPMNVRWSSISRDPVARNGSPPTKSEPLRAELVHRGTVEEASRRYLGSKRGQVVVVGGSDSGKTIFAIKLTFGLLEVRDPEADDPVPVLFMLGSWRPHDEQIDAWIKRKLMQDYGVSRKMAKKLVSDGLILPILDGFDEIPEKQRSNGLNQLNQCFGRDRPFVMTSRTDEFMDALRIPGPIGSAAVIELEPLTPKDIVGYLDPVGLNKWRKVRESLVDRPKSAMSTALSSPLMAALAFTVYSEPDKDPNELLNLPDESSVRAHLLKSFVPTMYRFKDWSSSAGASCRASGDFRPWRRKRHSAYAAADARRWLGFIASDLRNRSAAEICWWNQIRHLSLRDRALIRTAVAISASLMVSVPFFLAFPLPMVRAGYTDFLLVGLVISLGGGIGVGAIVAAVSLPSSRSQKKQPEPSRLALVVPRKLVRAMFIGATAPAVLVALALVALADEISWYSIWDGIRGGTGVAPAFAAAAAAGEIGKVIDLPSASSPRETLRADRTVFMIRFLVVAGAFAVMVLASSGIHWIAILVGISCAMVALKFSSWWGYVAATTALSRRELLPRNLIAFLDDACDRDVLRRVGASYQFRHAALLESLADSFDDHR